MSEGLAAHRKSNPSAKMLSGHLGYSLRRTTSDLRNQQLSFKDIVYVRGASFQRITKCSDWRLGSILKKLATILTYNQHYLITSLKYLVLIFFPISFPFLSRFIINIIISNFSFKVKRK